MLTNQQKQEIKHRTLEKAEKFFQEKEREKQDDRQRLFNPLKDNLGFRLARLWKNYPDATPDDFLPYANMICKKYKINIIDLENEIDFGWEFAETADDSEEFERAYALAKNQPLPVEMLRGKVNGGFRMTASTFYYLDTIRTPFHLHAEELSALLGFSQSNNGDAVRKISKQLIKRKLIECVDSDYRPNVKGKLYRWTGDRMKEHGEDIEF